MSALLHYFGILVQCAVWVSAENHQLLSEAEVAFPHATCVRGAAPDGLPLDVVARFLVLQFPDVVRQACR